jgi:hypothetical protein
MQDSELSRTGQECPSLFTTFRPLGQEGRSPVRVRGGGVGRGCQRRVLPDSRPLRCGELTKWGHNRKSTVSSRGTGIGIALVSPGGTP